MCCISLIFLATIGLFTGSNTPDNFPMRGHSHVREVGVVIIGAGISGLAAASRLRQHGFQNVTILEANDRIGGRANTIVFDSDRFIELGAQWVHGEDDNAVYALAVEKGLMHYAPKDQEETLLFRTDTGVLVNIEHGEKVMDTAEEALKNSYAVDDGLYPTVKDYLDYQLLNFHASNPTLDKELIEALWRVAEGGMRIDDGCDSFTQMSLQSYAEFRHCEGNYMGLLKKGYISVVEELAYNIPKESISLGQKVTRIDTANGQGVRVFTEDGVEYNTDHVIVTVSLGVMKAKAQDLFLPSLPKTKLEAFQALGFGTVNKVFLEFETAFWEEDGWDALLPVWTGDNMNPDLPWEHFIVAFEVSISTKNTLVAWLSGQAARQMEGNTEDETISTCVKVLKRFAGIQRLPKLVSVHRSRWFSDDNFKGSYSFRTVESNLITGLNNTLSEPLYGVSSTGQQPVVLFAGEYTHPYYYSTAHGAVDSGIREADRLINYYDY